MRSIGGPDGDPVAWLDTGADECPGDLLGFAQKLPEPEPSPFGDNGLAVQKALGHPAERRGDSRWHSIGSRGGGHAVRAQPAIDWSRGVPPALRSVGRSWRCTSSIW